MHRRPVGVALVVLALAAVMVVPALSGIRTIGTAVPIALPDPPAVGACVVRLYDATANSDSTPPQLSVTALRFGSCRGSLAGEVVAFWPNQQVLAEAPRSRRAGPCYAPMSDYAGLLHSDAPGSAAVVPEPVSWRPTLSYRAFLVTPSGLEQRAGRDWSACVIAPGSGRPYRGSLYSSYSDGSLPVDFGSCWNPDHSGLLVGPGDCTRAHRAQLVATGRNDQRGFPPAADVAASCTRVAGLVMDADDPTRGGQLTVVADRMDRLTRTWSGNPSSIGCFVSAAGDRRMAGLVIGLGDRPVPFVT